MIFLSKLQTTATVPARNVPKVRIAVWLHRLNWIAITVLSVAGCAAEAGSVSMPVPYVRGISRLNTASVAAFAKAQIPNAMREGKIPGAVFVVVSGDQVVFQKGYGLANVESRELVSTNRTLFRVASISKILTAASVLQLAHAHLLRLHRDVNRYLTGFHVVPAFGVPITLFDLLTHTSGFDVCPLDYGARTEAQKLSLHCYLTECQPVRVRPPGLFSGYDNYGYALAGYLVQRASGIPFPDYMERNILQPLGMDHSSFTPDPALRRQLATGYWLDDGTLHPYRQTHVNITPAAGLCSTASDMSRFLIALLTDERPDGARAFPGSVMHGLERQQFGFDPQVPGRCYGFDEVDLDGRRVLRQSGQWPGFNSLLLLFPRQHCGLFIAYNLCDYLRMARQISRSFVEQFLPPPQVLAGTKPLPIPTPDELRPLCGSYLSVRFPQVSPDFGVPPGLEVTQGQAGQLEIGGRPYHQIGPLVFEQTTRNGVPGRRIAFRLGRDGQVADLITQSGAFRRVPWSETRQGLQWLMRAASFVFLSVLVWWPIGFVVRFIGKHTVKRPAGTVSNRHLARFAWLAWGTAMAACALALWFEVSMALAELRLGPFGDFYGLSNSIRNLACVLPVLMVLTAVLGIFSFAAWRCRLWTVAHRMHYTLIAPMLALFLYVFYCQHLLFIAFPGNGPL